MNPSTEAGSGLEDERPAYLRHRNHAPEQVAWVMRADEVFQRYFASPSGGGRATRNQVPLTLEDEAFILSPVPEPAQGGDVCSSWLMYVDAELREEIRLNHDPRFALDLLPIVSPSAPDADSVAVEFETQRQAMAIALYQFIVAQERRLYEYWDQQGRGSQSGILLNPEDRPEDRAEKLARLRMRIRFSDDNAVRGMERVKAEDLKVWDIDFYIDPSSNFTVEWREVARLPQAQTAGGRAFLRQMMEAREESWREMVEGEDTVQWVQEWAEGKDSPGRTDALTRHAMDTKKLELMRAALDRLFPES